jgi:type I restriction enzyme, S subunit
MVGKYRAYPEYKDSGVEWVEKIPSHWEISKLRYMFTFSKGLTITKEHLSDQGIPCVNYGEVHSKFGFEVNPAIHDLSSVSVDYLDTSQNSLLFKGDFVFADTSEDIDGSGNFTQLTSDKPVFAGYHTIIVRPNDRMNSRFYAYLFDCDEFRTQIRHAVKGVKVFSITQAILRGANIWLPNTKEQQQIANFLDHETAKVDTLIKKQQQLITLLKEKRQAVISHAVTKGLNPDVPMRDSGVEWLGEVPAHWVILQLRRITTLQQGLQIPQENRFYEEGDGRMEYITIKSINAREMLTHKEYIYSPSKRVICRKNDILLARTGATGQVITNITGVFHNNFFKVNYDKNKIIKDYLVYFLKVREVKSHLLMLAGTTTIPDLNHGAFLGTLVCLPSKVEQNIICEYLDKKLKKIDLTIKRTQQFISLMQERRTALISAAVTGKIDVRLPA